MKKDLSRFCTPSYIKKLQDAKPGTKVIMHKPRYQKDLTIGGPHHNTACVSRNQKTWVGILEHNDGYLVGSTYVFEIVNNNRIVYEPWNKPSV